MTVPPHGLLESIERGVSARRVGILPSLQSATRVIMCGGPHEPLQQLFQYTDEYCSRPRLRLSDRRRVEEGPSIMSKRSWREANSTSPTSGPQSDQVQSPTRGAVAHVETLRDVTHWQNHSTGQHVSPTKRTTNAKASQAKEPKELPGITRKVKVHTSVLFYDSPCE